MQNKRIHLSATLFNGSELSCSSESGCSSSQPGWDPTGNSRASIISRCSTSRAIDSIPVSHAPAPSPLTPSSNQRLLHSPPEPWLIIHSEQLRVPVLRLDEVLVGPVHNPAVVCSSRLDRVDPVPRHELTHASSSLSTCRKLVLNFHIRLGLSTLKILSLPTPSDIL
jgi:hypothetical protein